MKKIIFLLITILSAATSFAQILEPSSWSTQASQKEVKVGDEIELIFKASIIKDWYLYSSDFDPDCGPMVTTFYF